MQSPNPWRSASWGGAGTGRVQRGKFYLEKDNRALWNSCEPVNNFSKMLD